jgi:hypothetical protein
MNSHLIFLSPLYPSWYFYWWQYFSFSVVFYRQHIYYTNKLDSSVDKCKLTSLTLNMLLWIKKEAHNACTSANALYIWTYQQQLNAFQQILCYSYLLTPWSRVLLEKLTGFQLVKKFLAFYGTRRFITTFTSARHLSLSSASSIQSIPPYLTSLSFMFHAYSYN